MELHAFEAWEKGLDPHHISKINNECLAKDVKKQKLLKENKF